MSQIAIEMIITIAVVIIQLFFYVSTLQKIKEHKNIFPKNELDEKFLDLSESDKGIVEQIIIDPDSFSDDFSAVIDSINKYLTRNKGATDFSIIKNIVERKIESKENFVASNISLPLYIGLMGTFVGIVIGLFSIAFSGGVTAQNINSFIGGVVIAMIASFFGLLLTVLNNSYNFKNAKAVCDERKNSFFDFLQIELLPYLENSLYAALERLKSNINDFNNKFESNIQLFDTNFSGNIKSLGESVQTLSLNIGAVVENTNTQKEFLIELKKLGYNRLAEANMKVFTLIKDTVPTLIEFIQKQKELNHLVGQTAEFTSTIENIFDRIKSFEQSINQLGENISTKEYLGNEVLIRIDNNLKYLDKQYEILKQHEINSSQEIYNFFIVQYEKIKELAEKIRREVETALDFEIDKNPLQKLMLLEVLAEHLNSINEKLNFNGEVRKISDYLNRTKDDIQNIKETLVSAIDEGKKINGPHLNISSTEGEDNNTSKQKRKSEVARK